MISKKKPTKKFLALLLAFVLVLTTIPVGMFTVFAANDKFTIVVVDSDETSKIIKNASVTISATCSNDTVLSEKSFTSDDSGKIMIAEISDYLGQNTDATIELNYSATADNYQSSTKAVEISASNVADDFNLALTPNPTVTVSGGADGTQLLVDGKEIESGSQVEVNTQVTLVVAGKENCIANVSPQAESVNGNSYTYTVLEDLNIRIEYTAITYKVKVNVGDNGKVSPVDTDGTVTVVKTNEKTTLEITPDTGYYVSKITFDKSYTLFTQSDNIKEYSIDNSEVNDDNSEVSVEFSIKTFSVTKDYVKQNQKEEGRGSIDIVDDSGKTLDDNALTNVKYGTELTAVFTPTVDYALINITNNGKSVSENEINYGADKVEYPFEVTENTEILADFSEVTILDLNIDDIINVSNAEHINDVYYVKNSDKSTTISLKNNDITYKDVNGNDVTIKTNGITGYVDVNSEKVTFSNAKETISLSESDTITKIQFQFQKSKHDIYQVNGDITVIFDGKKPTIDFPEKKDSYENAERTITFTVEDPTEEYNGSDYASGIASVTVSYINGEGKRISDKCTYKDGKYSFEYNPSEFENYTGNVEYTVTVTDNAGNSTEGKYIVKNDTTAPQLDGENAVSFEQNNTSVFAHALNQISRGKWFESTIEVTVKATDKVGEQDCGIGFGNDSSIAQIALVEENGNVFATGSAKFNKSGEATITLNNVDPKSQFKGSIYYNISDALGNGYKEYNAETIKSNWQLLTTEKTKEFEKNDGYVVMIEENKPVISDITPSSLDENGRNSGDIYSGDIKFDFNITDDYSGIYSYCVTINNTVVLEKSALYGGTDNNQTEILDTGNLTVNTGQDGVTANSDGSYNIKVTATDYSGNVADDKSITVYKDTTAATISGFEFSLKDNIDVTGKDNIYEAVDVMDYGFYFKKDVVVTISADDFKADNEIASGVASITYKAVDIDGHSYEGTDVAVDSDGKISFTINKDFKGQIYAYATDKVGNTPNNNNLPVSSLYDSSKLIKDGTYKGYVHPDGSIVETTSKHTETSTIEFTSVEAAQGTQNNSSTYKYDGSAQADKVMDYETNVSTDNVPLYNKDISFGVKVTDSYSGIREVSYTVIEGNEKTKKTIKIDNTGAFDGNNEGWKITNSNKKDSDNNLVTEITNTIAVSGNYNDMVLLVELTDRAGNKSYDYYVFGIDKTAPEITVTYDNNSSDTKSGDGNYFSANRTATIVVKERNFNTDQVKFTLKNAEGDAPKIVDKGQTKTDKNGNGDGNEYTYKIAYKDDGVYSFKVAYTDRATNKASVDTKDSVAPYKFTLDKTAPTISVSYDNNKPQNGKYFKASRTATITIVEHNFDVNRVVITQTAKLNGEVKANPTVSWVNSGNTHTGTINYSADGDYTFDITMTDKAGNKESGVNYGSSVAAKEFTVDTDVKNIVKVSGIKDGEVLGLKDGVVDPNAEISIKIEDVNLDNYNIKLTRSRVVVDGESLNDLKDVKNVNVQDKNLYDDNDEDHNEIENDINVTKQFIGNDATGKKNTTVKFNISKRDDKEEIKNDGLYTLTIEAKDKAGNAYNTDANAITFLVDRFGSVFTFGDSLYNLITTNEGYTNLKDEDGNDKPLSDLVIYEYNATEDIKNESVEVISSNDSSILESGNDYTVTKDTKQTDTSWSKYTYKVKSKNFAKDGTYTLRVSSKDAASITSQTVDYDICSATFRVDTTPADIISVNYSTNVEKIPFKDVASAKAESLKVNFTIEDAIRLERVEVYVNYKDGDEPDSIYKYSNDSKNANAYTFNDANEFEGSFKLERSSDVQNFKIVATDKAGNIIDTEKGDSNNNKFDPGYVFFDHIAVTTNQLVIWAKSPVFWGIIAAVAAAVVAFIIIILVKRRKKDDDEENPQAPQQS